jgi:4-alpha-glucanotransferase
MRGIMAITQTKTSKCVLGEWSDVEPRLHGAFFQNLKKSYSDVSKKKIRAFLYQHTDDITNMQFLLKNI